VLGGGGGRGGGGGGVRVTPCLESRPTVRCSEDLEAERYEVTETSDLHCCDRENYGLPEFDTVHSGTCERHFRIIMEPVCSVQSSQHNSYTVYSQSSEQILGLQLSAVHKKK